MLKKLVDSFRGGENHKIDPEELKTKNVDSRWVCNMYGISQATLKNYRRGFYFRGGERHYYYETKRGGIVNLRHIPQVDGEPVWYKVSWVNEWLKLIGQEELIPSELSEL